MTSRQLPDHQIRYRVIILEFLKAESNAGEGPSQMPAIFSALNRAGLSTSGPDEMFLHIFVGDMEAEGLMLAKVAPDPDMPEDLRWEGRKYYQVTGKGLEYLSEHQR